MFSDGLFSCVFIRTSHWIRKHSQKFLVLGWNAGPTSCQRPVFPSVLLPSLKTRNFPFTGKNLKFVNSRHSSVFCKRLKQQAVLLITKLSPPVSVWWSHVWCMRLTLTSPADSCCLIRGFMFLLLPASFLLFLSLTLLHHLLHFSSFALLLCASQKHREHYWLDGFDFVGVFGVLLENYNKV